MIKYALVPLAVLLATPAMAACSPDETTSTAPSCDVGTPGPIGVEHNGCMHFTLFPSGINYSLPAVSTYQQPISDNVFTAFADVIAKGGVMTVRSATNQDVPNQSCNLGGRPVFDINAGG